MVSLVETADSFAARLLAAPLPARWKHVVGVASRAARAASALSKDDGVALVSSAWLHDIGYSPDVAKTGFHPLDGALFARDAGFPERMGALVAHHSAAMSEASVFGVSSQLAEFVDERTVTRDLLWYLDMTTGPDGHVLSFENRMADVRQRYPNDHYVIRALDLGMPERVAAVERAQTWLTSVGLASQV